MKIAEEVYNEMKMLIADYENNEEISEIEQPYIEIISIEKTYIYNPNFGDERICECGHSYYRHFDTYDKMYACGCKYCGCGEFIEQS